MNTLLTIGEIARRLGVERHHVQYVVRSRGIKPIGKAAKLRVFDETAVGVIGEALAAINSSRGAA